jgi:SAM-dependent methyltransferase
MEYPVLKVNKYGLFLLKRVLDSNNFNETENLPIMGGYYPSNLINDLKCFISKEKQSYFKSFFPKFHYLRFKIKKPNTYEIFKFFSLNYGASVKEIQEIIGNECLKYLKKMNFLYIKNGKIFSNFTIRTYNNLYFISDSKRWRMFSAFTPNEYTFYLIKKIQLENIKDKKVLDLGTGNGIIAILLSKKNKITIGSDINPRALEIAKTNVVFNNIPKGRIRFIQADLTNCFKLNSLDFIISHFPLGIAPKEMTVPICIYGGETGYELFMKSFYDTYNSLKIGGTFCGLVECGGDNNNGYLIKELEKIKDLHFKMTLEEFLKFSKEEYIYWICRSYICKNIRGTYNLYNDLFNRFDYSNVYFYYFKLKKLQNTKTVITKRLGLYKKFYDMIRKLYFKAKYNELKRKINLNYS